METNVNNPQDKVKDSPSASASPPVLPQTAVRQSTDLTMIPHMSFSDEDEELETSTSSSTEEDGSYLSSPNHSVFFRMRNPNINSVFTCLNTEANNVVEEEELEEGLEEGLEEELEEGLEEGEGAKKEEVATLSSVHDVEIERFAMALVVTRDMINEHRRLISECARATTR